MTTQPAIEPRQQDKATILDTQPGQQVGVLPEASRLSILSHLNPENTLVGADHLIDAAKNGTDKKIAVAICDDKIVVSIGVRTGPYSRQHWQLIQDEGSRLHPEAKGWLDPTSHRPRDEVWVRATAFKVEDGKVILGGGSLLFESPSPIDSVHLTEFLQRALDSHR
jgi:hypothetical protein